MKGPIWTHFPSLTHFTSLHSLTSQPDSKGSTRIEGLCDMTLVHTAFFPQKEQLPARLREA